MADQKITDLTEATSVDGTEYVELVQSSINKKATTSLLITTREFNRTFSEELVFDKNEIFHAPFVQSAAINLTISAVGLVDESSSMRFRMTADGVNPINFGIGFDFLYGITNGQILDAGTYEFYFLYTNGSVVVNVPGVSSETSGLQPLDTPANFTVVTDGENALDLSWDDVDDEVEYQIEKSLTGTGGWVLFSNPAADATSDTETGLNPGDTVFYRIKAVGDGVNNSDSAYATANGTTESSGDVTAPVPTFLPANGNNVWPVNQPLTITMDEDIRDDDGVTVVSSANASDYLVLKETNSGGTDIPFTATYNSSTRTFTITPVTIYGVSQLVYLAIDGIEDVNGNEMSLQSITFTTTDFTFLNGTSNRLQFGDILDSVLAGSDTNFELEITIRNHSLTGLRTFFAKADFPGNQRTFLWAHNGADIFFYMYGNLAGTTNRVIKWANALTSGEQTLTLQIDMSIDTNDGLDRAVLLKNAVPVGSKTLNATSGAIFQNMPNSTSQFTMGAPVNAAGAVVASYYFSGEAKDLVVRSTGGAVDEIDVPLLADGEDVSGNNRDGTWV